MPRSKLCVLPRAGHLLLFDEPLAAAAVIKPLLAAGSTDGERTTARATGRSR